MDAEQNDTVEDTRDAQYEDAESFESTEKDAEISGNGDTDEDDGASGGDGAAGNDDAQADDDGEMEAGEEATPPAPRNVETNDELEDALHPFSGKMTNPPDDDGPESERRKRSIDDAAECDEHGPLPTFPLKRARTAYFIFADEKRKAVSQEVCPPHPSLRMDHLCCRIQMDFSDSFFLFPVYTPQH